MKKIFLFFIFILMVGMVSAVPPVTQTFVGDVGIEIKVPNSGFIKQNQMVKYHTHIFNASDGMLITPDVASCSMHIYDDIGGHILQEDLLADSNGVDFKLDIGGGNFSRLGNYGFIVGCNTSDIGGFVAGSIQVTADGFPVYEDAGVAMPIMILLLLLTFAIYFIGSRINLKHNWSTFVVQRCIYLVGIWFIAFNITIAANFAAIGGMSRIMPMLFTLSSMVQLLAYVTTIIMLFSIIIGGLKLYKEEMSSSRMGN